MSSAKKEPKGAIKVEPEVLGSLVVKETDIERARRLDRKRGPGEQVYISAEIKAAVQAYAQRKGRFLKSCVDEAVTDFLRQNGFEIALQNRKDDEE